jgi:hypothetical protein
MATRTLRVLGVHGLGDHRSGEWIDRWRKALQEAISPSGETQIVFEDASYDHIMGATKISPWETAAAVAKLLAGAILGPRDIGARGGAGGKLHFTAGYVVAWVEDKRFQRQTRQFILDKVREFQPDVVLAHSLGTLITYNAFSHADAAEPALAALLQRVTYVTIGSQIGNNFVKRNLTHGRIEPLAVRFWRHVFNRHDDVFTAPIALPGAANFSQTRADFDTDDDHKAESYINHANTVSEVWTPLTAAAPSVRAFGAPMPAPARRTAAARRAAKRALLIGINEYPNEKDRLEGCVNDVFLMSSVLQECGFDPESIRVCLNDRATTQGMLERLAWLLDDPRPGDERLFYYSGHGARLPSYGADGEPDHHLEALVPWDFDWTPQRAITDEQIHQLYSQLPYDMHFAMVLDCCHSGGMHRDGAAKARGITPPDDIRHRELKWDLKTRMWVSRDFDRREGFTTNKSVNAKYFGENGATLRLGRAAMLRGLTSAEYQRVKRAENKSIVGPYLPLIIQACDELQYSYEYRHGSTSYGAFTYSLAQIVRQEKRLSFKALVEKTSAQLEDLQYQQNPQILGPEAVMGADVPWMQASSPAPRRAKAARKASAKRGGKKK